MAKTKTKQKDKDVVDTVVDALMGAMEDSGVNPRFAHLQGGRPRAIATVEEMEERLIAYLNGLGRWGLPTKAGLSFAMGISRDTLNRYEKQEGFSDALRHWYALFEDMWAQRLSSPNAAGTIFYLKNAHGYVDRHETDSTSKVVHYILPPAIAAKHGVPITQPEESQHGIKQHEDGIEPGEAAGLPAAQPENEQGSDGAIGESADGSAGADPHQHQLEEEDGEVPNANG